MSQTLSSAEHQALVEQLADPRTRRAARHKLVSARAVGPLLECLASYNESVVWAAVESLGELRAPEAAAPLVELLSRGALTVHVCEALARITGQDFGADVRKWREWISRHGGAEPPKLDVAACVRGTSDQLGVEPVVAGTTYQYKLEVGEGRAQKVAVIFGRTDSQGEETVTVYSECGPANPQHYEVLLRKNLTMPAGAFAIRDIDGQAHIVIVDTLFAAGTTPSGLAKRVERLAARADAVEKQLAAEDVR